MDSANPQHDANKSEAITRLVQLLAALPKAAVPSAIDQSEGAAFLQREDAVSRLPDIFAAAFPSENHRAAYEEALKGAFSTFEQKKTVSEFIAGQFDADEERRKAFEQLADPLGLKSAAATAFQTSLPGFDPAETFEKKAAALYEAQHGLENLGRVAAGITPQDASAMFGLRPEDHTALTADEILRSSNWAAGHGAGIAPSEWADVVTGAALSKNAADIFKDSRLSDPEEIARDSFRLLSPVIEDPSLTLDEYESQRQQEFWQRQADHARHMDETIHKPYREKVKREEKSIELLSRSIELAEAQITETKEISKEARSISNHAKDLSEIASAASAESKIESRKAAGKSWLAIIISLAALLLTAWPFLKERIDGI